MKYIDSILDNKVETACWAGHLLNTEKSTISDKDITLIQSLIGNVCMLNQYFVMVVPQFNIDIMSTRQNPNPIF